jgi:hypothetical protein
MKYIGPFVFYGDQRIDSHGMGKEMASWSTELYYSYNILQLSTKLSVLSSAQWSIYILWMYNS